jgi:hypothetical protein
MADTTNTPSTNPQDALDQKYNFTGVMANLSSYDPRLFGTTNALAGTQYNNLLLPQQAQLKSYWTDKYNAQLSSTDQREKDYATNNPLPSQYSTSTTPQPGVSNTVNQPYTPAGQTPTASTTSNPNTWQAGMTYTNEKGGVNPIVSQADLDSLLKIGIKPNAPAGTSDADATTKIMSSLQNGYADVNSIATATGLDVNQVTKIVNSDYNISSLLNSNKANNDAQQGLNDQITKLNNIASGNYTLTADEQLQLTTTQQQLSDTRAKLIEANQNYQEAIQVGGIRSGRQEFMNDIASGEYNKAVQDGITKVTDFDNQAALTISKLKQSFKDEDYKLASDTYDLLTKQLKQKTDAISNLQKITKDYYDEVDKNVTTKLNQQKLLQEAGSKTITDIAPAIVDSLGTDEAANEKIYQGLATYYNLDENIVKGIVAKTQLDTQTKETSLAKAQANTTKTVKTGSGKTAKTYEVTYDYKGNEVSRKLLGAGTTPTSTPTPTSTKITPEEKKWQTDLATARKNLAQGDLWGPNWDYLKNQYGVDNATLDQILNKDKYYTNKGKKKASTFTPVGQ